jgi:hypothetical protein
MNKLRAALIIFVVSHVLPVAAQTKPENNLSPRIRIYETKYLKADRAQRVGRFVESVVDVRVRWEPVVNGFVLNNMTGPADGLDKAEALLKRFDVPEPLPAPERQIEMTVNLISAYAEARAQASVPSELAGVVKEMKGALPYAAFNLVGSIQVNVRDGLRLEDLLPAVVVGTNVPYFYSLLFNEPSVSGDGKTVSVKTFRFGVKVPVGSGQYQDESITTSLSMHEGQKQVLGKIKLDPASRDDLFVVLSCKVK